MFLLSRALWILLLSVAMEEYFYIKTNMGILIGVLVRLLMSILSMCFSAKITKSMPNSLKLKSSHILELRGSINIFENFLDRMISV